MLDASGAEKGGASAAAAAPPPPPEPSKQKAGTPPKPAGAARVSVLEKFHDFNNNHTWPNDKEDPVRRFFCTIL